MILSAPIPRWPSLLALAVLSGVVLGPTAGEAARRSLRYELDKERITSFRFVAARSVTTEVVQLPEEAALFDHAPVLQRIASVDSHLEGRLERFVAKSYRDGTLGLVSRLVDLSGDVRRAGGSQPSSFEQLEGKSMSLRLHASGEVLHSVGWSHFMGGGRGGDLAQDVLLQAVFRLPRKIPDAEGLPTSFTLRIPIDPGLERREFWMLRYLPTEAPADCGKHCYAISYSGEIREEAEDQDPARPMSRVGRAEVSGTLVLAGRGPAKRLLSHRWAITWDRDIASYRGDGSIRGRLRQQVKSSGRLDLLGAAELE